MKTINLSEKEFKALIWMLELLSERLSNDGCNDLEPDFERIFTKKEHQEIAKKYELVNSKGQDKAEAPLVDFCFVDYLRWRLEGKI